MCRSFALICMVTWLISTRKQHVNISHVTMQISANDLHIYKQAFSLIFSFSGAHLFLPANTIGPQFNPDRANSPFFYVVGRPTCEYIFSTSAFFTRLGNTIGPCVNSRLGQLPVVGCPTHVYSFFFLLNTFLPDSETQLGLESTPDWPKSRFFYVVGCPTCMYFTM